MVAGCSQLHSYTLNPLLLSMEYTFSKQFSQHWPQTPLIPCVMPLRFYNHIRRQVKLHVTLIFMLLSLWQESKNTLHYIGTTMIHFQSPLNITRYVISIFDISKSIKCKIPLRIYSLNLHHSLDLHSGTCKTNLLY